MNNTITSREKDLKDKNDVLKRRIEYLEKTQKIETLSTPPDTPKSNKGLGAILGKKDGAGGEGGKGNTDAEIMELQRKLANPPVTYAGEFIDH